MKKIIEGKKDSIKEICECEGKKRKKWRRERKILFIPMTRLLILGYIG